jgi:hypothetical protein
MSPYSLTTDNLDPVSRTTFAAESLLERKDLLRPLRRDISPVGDDLMVIAEEYGDWRDSKRRIDLLWLSNDAGLWLNLHGLDITCIRLRPYRMRSRGPGRRHSNHHIARIHLP